MTQDPPYSKERLAYCGADGIPVPLSAPETAVPETAVPEAVGNLQRILMRSLQSPNLVILAGAGASLAAGYPAMWHLWKAAETLAGFAEVLKTVDPESLCGSSIEKFLSRCDAYLELYPNDKNVGDLRLKIIGQILELCGPNGNGKPSSDDHRILLRKLMRRRTRDARLKIFTTNYDVLFETAASTLGLVAIDGFSFSEPRTFDPRYFELDIVRRGRHGEANALLPGVFQYFKLHGSVTWKRRNGDLIVGTPSADDACIIYPTTKKFQISYTQPHLELVSQFLSAIREPNTCLLTIGFGFNDDHLSEHIVAALRTNPHFSLVVVSPEAVQNVDWMRRFPGGKPMPDEKKPEGCPVHHIYQKFAAILRSDPSVDATFIASKLDQFVPLVPDLTALSPEDQLVRSIRRIAEQDGFK